LILIIYLFIFCLIFLIGTQQGFLKWVFDPFVFSIGDFGHEQYISLPCSIDLVLRI